MSPINDQPGGLVRPAMSEADAVRIARECYGLDVTASELGSNQDRNFLLTEPSGARSVLRIDNPVCTDEAREAQHAAIEAYRLAGVPVATVLAGLDGGLTQRWNGFAVRRSEFAAGEPLVSAGYLAPIVVGEFGALAAASVSALATLEHPGLDRHAHMWDMRVAYDETVRLAEAISDHDLRDTVLRAAGTANEALRPLRDALPVQAIHGDLTDDNVMGVRGGDGRLHPGTVLDLGDLGYGWRVAELAVTVSSLLHHEPERPLRVLDAIASFHRVVPLNAAEARAVWPLVMLRAALLVASGHRQLEIDADNAYAEDRIAGEHAILGAAIALPMAVVTELVLARLGFQGVAVGAGLRLVAAPDPVDCAPLHSLLPGLKGEVSVLDLGVESVSLDGGRWLDPNTENLMIREACAGGAAAVVLPYGVYRLSRTQIDQPDERKTWSLNTEIYLPEPSACEVSAPVSGRVEACWCAGVVLEAEHGWRLVLSGVSPEVVPGAELRAGDRIGLVTGDTVPHRLTVGWRRGDAWQHGATPLAQAIERGEVRGALGTSLAEASLVPAWRRLSHDPAAILGLESHAVRDDSGDEQLRRERIFASAQERYYERPMQIERGWRHHLVDTTGRAYVDMVNNVTGLGHGHPGVAEAVNRQIRRLNTNSRFLYRSLAEYSERLLALLPGRGGSGAELDTVLLVNSGSEAVDLALRLAQAATGRKTVVALREAYHGWTMASDAVTTSAFDNPFALDNRPEWVHVADVPNRFRGTYRGGFDDASVGQRYVEDLAADLARLGGEGRPVAGFICESVLGNAGGVLLPEGYLAGAYQRVREAGGLCIADEVQVGFGRLGSSFWGFEQSGVLPDIITIAKPMGNGFPIGGVITSKRIADALATQGQFFSSAGGNPLSCQVGLAVLDAMQAEGLQENAQIVGSRLLEGFRALAAKHPIVGPVHGVGLYLGVELVRNRDTMEPAAAEAAAICERMRELGVIVLTTSERSNVLKVKPPLTLTRESADFMVAQLDRVLTEGW